MPPLRRLSNWKKRRPITEQGLLNKLAGPRTKIACVGAFGHMERDPTPIALAQQLRGRNRVKLVDCKDLGILDELRARRLKLSMAGKRIPNELQMRLGALEKGLDLGTGVGGLRSYRESVNQFIKDHGSTGTGQRFTKPVSRRISLQPGLAWETGIKPGSLDLLIDRGTLGFVTVQGIETKRDLLQKTIDHYISRVRIGGKAVFIFKKGELMTYNRLWNRSPRDLFGKMAANGAVSVEEVGIKHSKFKIGGIGIKRTIHRELALIITRLK